MPRRPDNEDVASDPVFAVAATVAFRQSLGTRYASPTPSDCLSYKVNFSSLAMKRKTPETWFRWSRSSDRAFGRTQNFWPDSHGFFARPASRNPTLPRSTRRPLRRHEVSKKRDPPPGPRKQSRPLKDCCQQPCLIKVKARARLLLQSAGCRSEGTTPGAAHITPNIVEGLRMAQHALKEDNFHFANFKPLPDVECKSIDYDEFENRFMLTLRDTRDGTSILMTASVPALISLAHACCAALPRR